MGFVRLLVTGDMELDEIYIDSFVTSIEQAAALGTLGEWPRLRRLQLMYEQDSHTHKLDHSRILLSSLLWFLFLFSM